MTIYIIERQSCKYEFVANSVTYNYKLPNIMTKSSNARVWSLSLSYQLIKQNGKLELDGCVYVCNYYLLFHLILLFFFLPIVIYIHVLVGTSFINSFHHQCQPFPINPFFFGIFLFPNLFFFSHLYSNDFCNMNIFFLNISWIHPLNFHLE